MKKLGLILWGLGLISLFFTVIPIAVYRIVHEGVMVLAFLTLLFFFTGWLCLRDKRPKLRALLLVCLCLGLGVCCGFFAQMIRAAFFNAPPPGYMPGAAIVLGCEVRTDGPSLMLRKRLDLTALYLEENGNIPCVVSGGQGGNEPTSEASVMKEYLMAKGVPSAWILLEDQSTNTLENLNFSTEILRENMLDSSDIIIFTDGFHQMRAGIYARQNGFVPYAVSSPTPWGLAPSYWFREILAICQILGRMWISGVSA